jgi:hypothetical protein
VTVSSFVHRQARLDLSNLPLEHGYHRSAAYNRSKLADLLFTNELQRRPCGGVRAPDGRKLPALSGAVRAPDGRELPALSSGTLGGGTGGLARRGHRLWAESERLTGVSYPL